jgi:ferredoxin-NADP reductase
MKKEMIKQLNGYEDILREIDVSRKFGSNFKDEKGKVKNYISHLHPSRIQMRVVDIIDETGSTRTFRLVPEDAPLPPFIAGQYITVFVETGGIQTARPYSISSAPNQRGYYEITIRRVPEGLVSCFFLDKVKPGDVIQVSGPQGFFYYNPVIHEKTAICIAGGSGITPFMSMIREVAECGHNRKIRLIYGNRSVDDIIFHEELTRISERFDNISYIPVLEMPPEGYSGKKGFITADVIREVSGTTRDKTFFLCGPPAMYDFCLPELEKLEIPKKRLKKEMYGAPDHIWEYPGWPEGVSGDETFSVIVNKAKPFKAKAGEPLLKALEKNGVLVPSICRSGECSMCRVKITSGKVFQPTGVPVRASDKAFGYVHSCVSFPITDINLII